VSLLYLLKIRSYLTASSNPFSKINQFLRMFRSDILGKTVYLIFIGVVPFRLKLSSNA